MASRWILRLTILALATSLLLITVGVYLVATQGRDLTAARQRLAEAEAQVAVRNSSLLYFNHLMGETSRLFTGVKDLPRFICVDVPRGDASRRMCDTIRVHGVILDTLNPAAVLRASASDASDYEEAGRLYEDALSRLEGLPETGDRNRWLAYAYEGVAYSQYRRGRLAQAASAIQQARRHDRNSLMVAITELKIKCARNADPALVVRELAELRRRLSAAQSAPNVERPGARQNRALRGIDDELAVVCRYATADSRAERTQ